jgi:hypothetical protein
MDQLKTILAKFWVGILCAIIAIAAIIASFWPIDGYHEELYGKLQSSARNYDKAYNLMHKERLKPVAPGQTTPDRLKDFPSPRIIKSGEELKDKVNEQSLAVVKKVVDINTHQPLVPGSLPNPAGIMPLEYRSAYNLTLGPTGTIYTDILHAGLPPTPEDVKARTDAMWADTYSKQLVPDPNNAGKLLNQESVDTQFKREVAKLPARMRQETAQKYHIYAAADAMPIDLNVANKNGPLPNPSQIWWSQMALWLEQDVAHAIANANAGAKDVSESPVKRLLRLEIPGPDQAKLFTGNRAGNMQQQPMNGMDGSVAPPAPITADANTPVPQNTAISPSGRVSCNMYDVVQFHLEMVVAAKDLPLIMDSIAKGRLMSVLNVESLTAEDVVAAETQGFFYGQDPVVRVRLTCEALFLRAWTLPLMPDSVKRMLPTGTPVAMQ